MNGKKSRPSDKIVVFWTSQDREIAQNMVFHYTRNFQLDSNWKRVRLVIWGPSIRLLALDKELQEHLEELKRIGIELQACESNIHANDFSDDLLRLGFDIVSISDPIAEYRKANWAIAIF
jgi:intracellular sulfur oxidation DsrE/DsrF family protein